MLISERIEKILSFIIVMALFLNLFPINVVYAASLVEQNFFRFYSNTDNVSVTDPWPSGDNNVGENEVLSTSNYPIAASEVIRLRLSLRATQDTLSSGTNFKLQFGEGSNCSAIGSWTDVGTSGSGAIWRGYDNTSISDGDSLTSILSVSDTNESYQEDGSFSNTNNIVSGNDAEWDFAIENNNASNGTTYCFRVVYADNSTLSAYNYYPKLTTKDYYVEYSDWRWYEDNDEATPTIDLEEENAGVVGVKDLTLLRLRLNLQEKNNIAGTGLRYKVRYSTSADFSSGVNDVVESGSCNGSSIWCYANGTGTADAEIASMLLTNSDQKGRYLESATGTTSDHSAGYYLEFDISLKPSGASESTVYYFQLYETTNSVAVTPAVGESYPNAMIYGGTLNFVVSGVNQGTEIDGVVMDVTTTSTNIDFGTVTIDDVYHAAQKLTVSSDWSGGYEVFVAYDNELTSSTAEVIPDISGTNASPVAWGLYGNAGAFGYHSTDDTLSLGDVDRFLSNDTYAAFETDSAEIMSHDRPVFEDVNYLIYGLELTSLQYAGDYETTIVYTVMVNE